MAAPTPPLLKARVKLPNGMFIPQVQLGLYMMSQPETSQSVASALRLGYRGFDSAQWYYNERQAGEAITSYLVSADNVEGLKREDIFFTSKLRDNDISYDAVRKSIQKSVKTSGLGYLDLFLLHSPYGGKKARLTSWKAVEDAIQDGEVRMGGVSNFGVKHIEELVDSKPKIKPVINQVEVHPFNTQTAIRETCAKHGIFIEAYAPLARGERMTHSTILRMANKYSCTAAQIFVRWSLHKGFITLPKSVRAERLRENVSVDHLELEEEDVEILDGLDEHLVTDWDPTNAP